MAITRSANLLSQQRLDLVHLRAVESSICHDFDVLAGRMMAGKAPLVVSGFKIVSTGITAADQLQLSVADAVVVHFFASESGSIFNVPADRTIERLNSTNPRLIGSFAPDAINYVGVDFTRTVDETTVDLVMFLDATLKAETPKTVPLARTIDYRIVVSTRDFNAQPGVCPIAKITTNAVNDIVSIVDARNLFFRLGAGGTSPNAASTFPWPAGRKEFTTGTIFEGGDKSITSLKGWMDAAMTRLWEVGGGEYWYSPTSDKNVRLVHTFEPFVSTGEYFEWDGTHAHWKGLRVLFDNSTASYNTINNRTTNLAGLTDLADGDCLYVDLNRSMISTLNPQKAPLVTLGSGSPPGSRLVFAWRSGDQLFTRDQGYSVGSSFVVATVAANGTVRLSASPWIDPATPIAVMLQNDAAYGALYQAHAGGITRGGDTGTVTDFVGGSGDLVIGGDTNDQSILLVTNRTQDFVSVIGKEVYGSGGQATLRAVNKSLTYTADNRIAVLAAGNDEQDAFVFEVSGALGMRLAATTPATPAPTDASPIRAKMMFQTNGLATPFTRDQFAIMWHDGSITPIAESPPY